MVGSLLRWSFREALELLAETERPWDSPTAFAVSWSRLGGLLREAWLARCLPWSQGREGRTICAIRAGKEPGRAGPLGKMTRSGGARARLRAHSGTDPGGHTLPRRDLIHGSEPKRNKTHPSSGLRRPAAETQTDWRTMTPLRLDQTSRLAFDFKALHRAPPATLAEMRSWGQANIRKKSKNLCNRSGPGSTPRADDDAANTPLVSVLGHARIDRLHVGDDTAAEVPGGGEAGLLQQRQRLGRAPAGLAVDDHRIGLRQLGQAARQLTERDQLRAGNPVDLPLGGLADVDQLDAPPVVEQLPQLHRGQRRAGRRGQRLVDEQPPDQRVADAGDELDRLVGLDRADRGAEHAEHAALGAGGNHARRGRLGVQAAVAGTVLGPEDAGLPVEAVDRAPHVRLALEHAAVVDQIAGGEVVGAVHDQVVVADDPAGVLGGETGLVEGDLDVGVDLADLVAGALQLGAADVRGAVDDLPLQVGGVNVVEVDDADVADAGGGQVHGVGRAEAAGPDQQHAGVLQPLLPIHRHVGDDQVPRVAEDLIPRQLTRRLDQCW